MNYNIKDIIPYFENFRPYEGRFTEQDVEDFIDSIDRIESFEYDQGATKLVIIPATKDYVIKIPFTGEKECVWGDEDDEEGGVDYEYRDFVGAESLYGNNYIDAEIWYYEAAQEYGYEKMFLPLECVYDWDGIPVYIQEKAECICNDMDEIDEKDYSSKASIETCLSIRKQNHSEWYGLDKFPIAWVASMMEVLGSFVEVRKFLEFLENFNIYNDLHGANIGYANGHAVIVDYGGYRG